MAPLVVIIVEDHTVGGQEVGTDQIGDFGVGMMQRQGSGLYFFGTVFHFLRKKKSEPFPRIHTPAMDLRLIWVSWLRLVVAEWKVNAPSPGSCHKCDIVHTPESHPVGMM
eukprot:CAMPEP_0194387270 /NCGR_PEP_ID=MMETSP0174-20130528/91301_1 /TAXON_ID=216777 /ORGANISM="Proboscia alata, Strain PI-D3" /LENGTH=109 /DNA_ID=CAMNT_0039177257 /DNA_START=142 /DNA_END=471 /DNA_ORIENTATION=-